MYYLIIDTCVWIDLYNNHINLLPKISGLVDEEKVKLILPEIIIDEWNRNKQSEIVESKQKSLRGQINNAREISQYLAENDAAEFKRILDKFGASQAEIEAAAFDAAATVERLFDHASTINLPVTEEAKLQTVEFALAGKTPFKEKNSLAAALIIFSSANYILELRLPNCLFISSNTKDFGAESINKTTEIHNDLKEIFERCGLRYFANIGQAMNEIEPNLVSDGDVSDIEAALQRESAPTVVEQFFKMLSQTLQEMEQFLEKLNLSHNEMGQFLDRFSRLPGEMELFLELLGRFPREMDLFREKLNRSQKERRQFLDRFNRLLQRMDWLSQRIASSQRLTENVLSPDKSESETDAMTSFAAQETIAPLAENVGIDEITAAQNILRRLGESLGGGDLATAQELVKQLSDREGVENIAPPETLRQLGESVAAEDPTTAQEIIRDLTESISFMGGLAAIRDTMRQFESNRAAGKDAPETEEDEDEATY